MTNHDFTLCGTQLQARRTGALWWPEAQLLCVSDLHLGKSERLARQGGALLPPYETRETLDRLAVEIAALSPRTVICLGDSFDDLAAGAALETADHAQLTSLMAGRRWIWVEGNHDPGPLDLGGTHVAEISETPLQFRHIARNSVPSGAEISGHYHPKIRLSLGGRTVSRPCFLLAGTRLILPAFGAYTGGLRVDHPDLATLTGSRGIAILTGPKTHAIHLPMPRQL